MLDAVVAAPAGARRVKLFAQPPVAMAVQFMLLGLHFRPFQPSDGMPSQAWEFSQILLSVIFAADAPLARHSEPPQPTQSRPSLFLESSQMCGQVMSEHFAPWLRHLEPPQPRVWRPRRFFASSQMAWSVTAEAPWLRERQ